MDSRSHPAVKSQGVYSPAPPAACEKELVFLVRRTHQRSMSLLLSKLEGAGLTPGQFFALERLRDGKSISQNELGRQTAMDPATIQGVIQRLLKRGLVARMPDQHDKRRLLLSMTPEGATLIAGLSDVAESAGRDLMRGLTPEQRRQAHELFKRLAS